MKKYLFKVLFLFFISLSILPLNASAAMKEYTRNGNDFSAASGSYATSSHCISGQTCGWISGNQAIVGVYYADPSTWGGTVRWDFNVDIPLGDVVKAEVMVEWPHSYGKGLHSPVSTGWGSISVRSEGDVVASLPTDVTTCSPTGDHYAHPCGMWYLKYDVPLGLVESTTKVYLKTGGKTAWDVMEVTLFVYTSEGNVKIINGKIYVNGKEFLVKGLDYAPWIEGSGPDPTLHEPFPGEYEDVTDRVTDSGNVYITDYSGDGKIQSWEVVEYDLEKMKGVGANTVRTYAAGEWHDKNLNGIIDISSDPEQNEIVQGDLPDWMFDRIITFCENNGMMVIIGYWVQEEDFKSGLICNWDDLEVAKDTMKRVVEGYSSSPAVLGWGIGNEVHGGWNHEWFTWGVDINDYLNSLFSYVSGIDDYTRPIMYAKYVGENTNFNTLTADVIVPNAYTHSAGELVTAGEFGIPEPPGRAYMLGEYGHIIGHAEGHWELSKDYAGGCFLEYDDVWWKGGGQDSLGIVDMYRNKRPERYNVVHYLYLGTLPGDVNGDCIVNIFDLASVGKAYGSSAGDSNWNENADLNGDGVINIFDLATVGVNYGVACS